MAMSTLHRGRSRDIRVAGIVRCGTILLYAPVLCQAWRGTFCLQETGAPTRKPEPSDLGVGFHNEHAGVHQASGAAAG